MSLNSLAPRCLLEPLCGLSDAPFSALSKLGNRSLSSMFRTMELIRRTPIRSPPRSDFAGPFNQTARAESYEVSIFVDEINPMSPVLPCLGPVFSWIPL